MTLRIDTGVQVPLRPAQCPGCEHHNAIDGTCLGFASTNATGGKRPAGFDGTTDEECERFEPRVSNDALVESLRASDKVADDLLYDAFEMHDPARQVFYYLVALEEQPGHKGAVGGLESCRSKGVEVDALIERYGLPASALVPEEEPELDISRYPYIPVGTAEVEAERWYRKGFDAIREGTDEEIRLHSKALGLDPNHFAAWGCLGRAHAEKGEWDRQRACQLAARIIKAGGSPDRQILENCGIESPQGWGIVRTPRPRAPAIREVEDSAVHRADREEPREIRRLRIWARIIGCAPFAMICLSGILVGTIQAMMGTEEPSEVLMVLPSMLALIPLVLAAVVAGMLAHRLDRVVWGWAVAAFLLYGIPTLVLSFMKEARTEW